MKNNLFSIDNLLQHTILAHRACVDCGGAVMKNVTISMSDELLEKGRRYAEKNRTSLNAIIRKLLAETVTDSSVAWLEDIFVVMDNTQVTSDGEKWSREEIYDV